MLKSIQYKFRFPAKQTGPFSIELEIRRGGGPPVLNTQFCEQMQLSDAEADKAEELVLRSIAILPEGVEPPDMGAPKR